MSKRYKEQEKAYQKEVEIYQKAAESADQGEGDAKGKGKSKKVPFAVAEAYKKIRTNIMFQLSQIDGKVIAVSSADIGEGKSTTSLNLAVTFSQTGGKTLLIDADLRRASLNKKMNMENKDGFSNILAGFSTVEKVMHHLSESLDVITAGPVPPNPSELLGSKRFVDFLAEARKQYDYIIIDTPPIDIVSDALVIAPHTDGVVMVVRMGYTAHYMLQRALDSAEFAKINILGVVANGVEMKAVRRYNKSWYGRYGRYGYGKYGRYGGYGGYGGYGYGGYGYGYGNTAYGYGPNVGGSYDYGHPEPGTHANPTPPTTGQDEEKNKK